MLVPLSAFHRNLLQPDLPLSFKITVGAEANILKNVFIFFWNF